MSDETALPSFAVETGNITHRGGPPAADSSAAAVQLERRLALGGVGVYALPDRSGLLFKSRMMIDADGAHNAYHPTNNSLALDYLPNAGKPGNWWGVVTDTGKRDGKPIVQKAEDPCPGFHASPTSLCDSSKSRTDPRRYVNSAEVPYLALPKELVTHGVRLGDLAVVVRGTTGACCGAVFADGGPSGKLGEGSVALARALGVPSSAKNGGTGHRDIIYLVFPGSRIGWPLSLAQIAARTKQLFEEWGGMNQLHACFLDGNIKNALDEVLDREVFDSEPGERPSLDELGESDDSQFSDPARW